MKPLQAFLVGSVAGCLMKAEDLDIETEIVTDEEGYLPEILVTGRVSGEAYRIKVEKSEEKP